MWWDPEQTNTYGKVKVVDEIKIANELNLNREIILDCADGPNHKCPYKWKREAERAE